MTKRTLAVLVACLAIAALGAGCGGGDDTTGAGTGGTTAGGETSGGASTEASGSAPTKAAFIEEADRICRDAEAALNGEIAEWAEDNGVPTGKEPSREQQEALYAEVVLPNVAAQGEEIAALTPPPGDEQAIEEITDALAEGVEEGEADPSQLVEGENPLADASAKARAYGMKSCGSE